MEQSEQPAYTFTAFISYKRGADDEKQAKWLQAKLESFRIPTEIAPTASGQTSGDTSGRRFRVFRDKTDLGSHAELREGLHKSLGQCRCLIVVCSPRSAASPYVDAEVRWFQDNGRADAIIPFIISGTPAPREGEEQCYPPSLSAGALGITLAEGSREEALIKIVARLLRVDFHSLYQRHLRAQRRFMMKVATGLTLVLALVVGLAVWAVNAERRATAQRKEAEGLVRFMTFDLRDEAFQYIPIKAREQITQKVEDYYQRWGAESLEARYARAAHLSNRAVRLFEAGDWSGVEALLPDILAANADLRKRLPDDAELLRIEATARSVRGALAFMRGGNVAESLAETEYGLELAREMLRKRPDDPAARHTLATMEETAARAYFVVGNPGKGLPHAEAAVDLRHDLTIRYPHNANLEGDYLSALDALCGALSSEGKASPAYDELIDIYRRKSAADPHSLELRLRLTGALNHKMTYFLRKGISNEAIALNREVLGILQDLLARDPGNTVVRSQAALTRAMEAMFRSMDGHPADETAALLAEAESDLARVADKDRNNLAWIQAQNSISLVKDFLKAQRNQEKQDQSLLSELQNVEKWLTFKPDSIPLALEFSNLARSASGAMRGGPHQERCTEYLKKAAGFLRVLARAHPDDANLRKGLLQTLISLARAHRADKNLAAAGAAGEEALTLLEAAGTDTSRGKKTAGDDIEALNALGKLFLDMDNIRGASDAFQKYLALSRDAAKENGAAERIQLVVALEKAGAIALELGSEQEGTALLDEAVQVSRRAVAEPSPALGGGEPLMLVTALHMTAIPAMDYNRLDTAAARLDEARTLVKNPPGADRMRENWRQLTLTILARRAGVELLRANPAAALSLLEEAAVFDGRSPEKNSETATEFPPGDRWDMLTVEALLMTERTRDARIALERAQAGMRFYNLEKKRDNLLNGAEAARLDALLLLRAGRKGEAAATCERVLPILEQRALKPEAGIFYSRTYLRLLSAYAASQEANGQMSAALQTSEKAAAYGRCALKIAPGHALLTKELREALLASARLKKAAGDNAGAAMLEKEAESLPAGVK